MKLKIRVKETVKGLYTEAIENGKPFPFINPKGNFIDLRCSESYVIHEGITKVIDLGFCLELPQGFFAHLVGRSSLFKNYGLITLSSGIIDDSYIGDDDVWKMPVANIKNGISVVEKGTRLFQFSIFPNQFATAEQKQLWYNSDGIKFEWVESFNNDNNRGGFGSTDQ